MTEHIRTPPPRDPRKPGKRARPLPNVGSKKVISSSFASRNTDPAPVQSSSRQGDQRPTQQRPEDR